MPLHRQPPTRRKMVHLRFDSNGKAILQAEEAMDTTDSEARTAVAANDSGSAALPACAGVAAGAIWSATGR